MNDKMRVALMTDVGEITISQREIPHYQEDEVLVKIEYVGICGSDLHYYESGGIGTNIVKPPFVLGHEAGGVVVAIGKQVTHLKTGDKVALEPGKTCGKCTFCKSGKYNLCEDVIFFATPPIDGVFQEYVAHSADLCFKIPENMDTMEAALIEPLSVGFHAALQGNAKIGQTAVVTGAGCIGLVCMMALKAMGVMQVYVVDILSNRLEKATELGATAVINAKETDVKKALQRLTDGHGADLVIETAGTEATMQQAIHVAKKGGMIVLVGYSPSGQMSVPVGLAIDKELSFNCVFRYRHSYPLAIEAVASGKINLKGIVTNIVPLDAIKDAMDQSVHNKADIIKTVIRIQPES